MDPDKWLTLPDDLLVDIFRRLDTTAFIRCTGTCRHWRRTIMDNARCLRPRPGGFQPDLLIGFFDLYNFLRLQYVPASNTAMPVPLLTGATTGVSVDGRLYNMLLSSRDGFLLLREYLGRGNNLCLWNAQTGICSVLPAAACDTSPIRCEYVLATGYDVSADGDESAVWILALQWNHDAKDGTTYQIFSSKTAAWGPVKRAQLPEDLEAHVYNARSARACMVSRGAVSWLVQLYPDRDHRNPRSRMCISSMDMSSGRTWITEIPPEPPTGPVVLAVSEEGQLSLVKMLSSSHQIEVWVLVGDGQWTLRPTMDVKKLIPNCRTLQPSGFCPRSGYLFGTYWDYRDLQHDFLIGIDGSSAQLIERVQSSSCVIRFPFEMDCSTYMSSYISKMKYF